MEFGTPKKKGSSTITLDTYVVGTETAVLHGEPKLSKDNKLQLGIVSVKLPPGLVPPKDCLVALYGFGDSATEMRRQRDYWVSNNEAIFQSVSMEFEVGSIAPHIVPLETVPRIVDKDGVVISPEVSGIKEQRFLNFMRTKVSKMDGDKKKEDVQETVRKVFKKYVEDEGAELKGVNLIEQIALRPDLWDRVLKENEYFQKIEVLVVPIAFPKPMEKVNQDKPKSTKRERQFEIRQFALITRRAKLIKVTQNPKSKIQAVPPDWLTKSSEGVPS